MASVSKVPTGKTDYEEGRAKNSTDSGVMANTHNTPAVASREATNVDHPWKENTDSAAVVAEKEKRNAIESALAAADALVASNKPNTASQSPARMGSIQNAPERKEIAVCSNSKKSVDSLASINSKASDEDLPRFFSKKHGRTIRTLWTPEEDAILLARLRDKTSEEIESIDWSALCEEILPHRDRQALRQHWYRRLDPRRKTGNWTLEEDILLIEKYQEHGPSWIKLSRLIGGRSDMDTLNRFKSITRSYGDPGQVLMEKKEALERKREKSTQPQDAEPSKVADGGGGDQKSHSAPKSAALLTAGDEGLPQKPSAEPTSVEAQVSAELKTFMDTASIRNPGVPKALALATFNVPSLDELLPQSPEERKQLEDAVKNSARRYNTGQLNKKWWSVKEDVALMHQLKGKTEEELKRFPWAELAKSFPGRDGKAMRDRYVLRLRPGRKTSEWTEEEIQTLISLQKEHGNSWAKISKFIPGRTPADVKNRFNSAAMMKRLNPPKKSKARPLIALMPPSAEARQAFEDKVVNMRTSFKGLKRQTWSLEEDIVLMFQLQGRNQNELPRGYWKDLSESFPGRSRKAIRDRYFLHLHPDRKVGEWTEEETAKLLALQQEHGNSWAKISTEIPGRSTDDVRSRFKTIGATKTKRGGAEEKVTTDEQSNSDKKRTRSSLVRAAKGSSDESISKNTGKRARNTQPATTTILDSPNEEGKASCTKKPPAILEEGTTDEKEVADATSQLKGASSDQNASGDQNSRGTKTTGEDARKTPQFEKAATCQPAVRTVHAEATLTVQDEGSFVGKLPDEPAIEQQGVTAVETKKNSSAEEQSQGSPEKSQLKLRKKHESETTEERQLKGAQPTETESQIPESVPTKKELAAEDQSNTSEAKEMRKTSPSTDLRQEESRDEQVKKASSTEKPQEEARATLVKKELSEPARRVTRGTSKESKTHNEQRRERKKRKQHKKQSSNSAESGEQGMSEASSKANSLPVKKRRRTKEDQDVVSVDMPDKKKKHPTKRTRRSSRKATTGNDDDDVQASATKGGPNIEKKAAEALHVTAAAVAKAIGWKGRPSKHSF